MASISSMTSSSSSAASALTGKGIGGLATGLNTDELVAALTAGTKAKISKQGQQKQLLNWKMNSYRTMATALSAFQSKSLKIGASGTNTNIMSSSFFNTYKATSSSDKVSVSTTSSSQTGNITIDKVTQLAESEKFSSISKLSSTLSLKVDENTKFSGKDAFTGQTLKLDVEGFSTKTIKLDDLNDVLDADGNITNIDTFKSKLQDIINGAYKSTTLVTVSKGTDGKLILDSGSARVGINTDNNVLGVKSGDTNRVDTSSKIGSLNAFKNVQGNALTFSINGVEISVSKDDTISALMSKVNNSGADVTMAYDKSNDKFTLTSKKTGADSKIDMRDLHGNLLNQIFGAKSGNGIGTDYLTTGTAVVSDLVNTIDDMDQNAKKNLASSLKNMSFDLTINGVTKTVKLDTVLGISSDKLTNGTYTSEDIYKAINKGIQNSFYDSGVEFSKGTGADLGKTVIKSTKGEAFNVNVSGALGGLIGIDGNTGNIVRDYGYNSTVAASSDFTNFHFDDLQKTGPFEMTINGVTKTVTVTQAKDSNGEPIKITSDNIVERLNAAIKDAFGEETAKLVSFKGEYKNTEIQKTQDGRPVVDANGNPVYEKAVKLSLVAAKNGNGVVETSVSIKAMDVNEGGNSPLLGSLGFSGTQATNANPGAGATFSDITSGVGSGTLTVNGKDVTYAATDTIQDFLKKLNTALGDGGVAGIKDGKLYIDSYGDTVTITDKDSSGNLKENRGADGNLVAGSLSGGMLKNVFGISGGSISTQAASYTKITEDNPNGTYREFKNALVTIDGVEREFSSNNISYNNVNLTLHDVSETAIKIGVQSDPDDVIKRIQEWMDDYNALVYTLNSAINEGKNRDYSPLTDDQKAGMTDDQIKTWDAEAKKGILRNDQTLRGILGDMRNVFYEKVSAAGISLYDIGIVTKSGLSDPNEAGQLEFDKNVTGGGEGRLRKMLTENPDKVRLLFTDENGIGAKLNSIINRAANSSSVDRGTLVRLAGTEKLTGDNTSTLGDKVSAIDKYIATLKARMESEYNRYWKKFSALETSVQKMNSQSSWLQSQ